MRVVEIPFFITLLKQTWKRKRIEWLEHKEDSKFTLLYTINRPHIYLFTKVFLEMSDSAFQTFRKSYWCTQKTDRNILTKNSIDKFSHDFYISFAFENIFLFWHTFTAQRIMDTSSVFICSSKSWLERKNWIYNHRIWNISTKRLICFKAQSDDFFLMVMDLFHTAFTFHYVDSVLYCFSIWYWWNLASNNNTD